MLSDRYKNRIGGVSKWLSTIMVLMMVVSLATSPVVGQSGVDVGEGLVIDEYSEWTNYLFTQESTTDPMGNTVVNWVDNGDGSITASDGSRIRTAQFAANDSYEVTAEIASVGNDTSAKLNIGSVIDAQNITSAGTYTWSVDPADGDSFDLQIDAPSSGDITVTSVSISPSNTAPIIDSGLDPATNITATANESVSFDASNSTDADNDSLTYSWDFDADGTEDANTSVANWTYETVGTYNVSLTISDGTDSVSETYTVVVEESTDDGTETPTQTPTESPTDDPVGGGSSGGDWLSTQQLLALVGSFIFAVAVGVAVRRVA